MKYTQEYVLSLQGQSEKLEQENLHLTETVSWMHDAIWDMLKENKNLEQQLNKEKDKTV